VPALARHLVVALVLLVELGACESRVPQSTSTQALEPTPAPAPAPKPIEVPETPLEPELPVVAGIHYLEFVTGGADSNAELPMIIALHGLGDSPENFANLLTGFDRPVRVILPRALEPHEGGWSWFPFRARDPDVDALAQGIDHAADALAPAIAELVGSRPTKGKPIITGFSQGGMLAFTLAVEHGDLFAAAFPIGGWLPPPLWPKPDADPKRSPAIRAFHGDADKAVALEPTEAAVAQLKASGFAVELVIYPDVGHMIPEQMHADLFTALREALSQIETAN
jgi:phospholipase/carboxylesterase